MNISTLARRAGISASGVRWYEAAGILPPPRRGSNGYRLYTESDLSRLKLILTLRRLGLGPAEAGQLAEALPGWRRPRPRARGRAGRSAASDRGPARGAGAARDRAGRPGAHHRCRRHGAGRARSAPSSPCCSSATATRPAARWARRCSAGSAARNSDRCPAGTRPKRVHPLTVRVLAELGIDWRRRRAKPVTELLDQPLDYVITLSNSAREECPAFPGPHSSLHWHLEDPAAVEGSEEERLEAFRATRTELSVRLRPFIEIARRAAGHLPAIERDADPEESLIMVLPYTRAPHAPGAGRTRHPGAAAARRGRRRALRRLRGRRHRRRLVGRALHPAPAGGRQPAGRGLAGEPRACRLVQGPAARGRRGVRARWPAASSARSCRSATSGACTSIAGATAARTSTSGSCHDRSACSGEEHMLPLWEDVLPNVSDEELADAARRVAAAL